MTASSRWTPVAWSTSWPARRRRPSKIYDGLYHETLNERPADRERVIDDLLAWLDAHSG